jgi:hypothetical protein
MEVQTAGLNPQTIPPKKQEKKPEEKKPEEKTTENQNNNLNRSNSSNQNQGQNQGNGSPKPKPSLAVALSASDKELIFKGIDELDRLRRTGDLLGVIQNAPTQVLDYLLELGSTVKDVNKNKKIWEDSSRMNNNLFGAQTSSQSNLTRTLESPYMSTPTLNDYGQYFNKLSNDKNPKSTQQKSTLQPPSSTFIPLASGYKNPFDAPRETSLDKMLSSKDQVPFTKSKQQNKHTIDQLQVPPKKRSYF